MGFVRQKLTGKGIAFIQAGGTVLEKVLEPGESIYLDQMSLVAWSSDTKVRARARALASARRLSESRPKFTCAVVRSPLPES